MNVENVIYNEECVAGLRRIESGSVDVVLTDPPYGYLNTKMQHWDVAFDEERFFEEVKRILKPSGFIVMFGRGTSFYRWNTRLAELGFKFKEEIVWDKRYCASPMQPVLRVHETISLHTPKDGMVRESYNPYLEIRQYDFDLLVNDVKCIRGALKNTRKLEMLQRYVENGEAVKDSDRIYRDYSTKKDWPTGTTISKRTAWWDIERSVSILRSIEKGFRERTIFSQPAKRYRKGRIHPTQKPVRLLERLLAVVSAPGALVVDPFSGSASTAVACLRTGRRYIGYEIDKTFYESSIKRLEDEKAQLAAAAKGAQGNEKQEEQLCLVNE